MPTVLQTLPDYDETVYTKKQFLDNLQVLADKTDQVKVCSNHRSFYLASRVQQVFYRVISHLGFEDRCNIIKVNYDILKFFHNGCINHYFLTLDVQNLLKSVQATMDDPNVKEAANEVLSLKPDIKEKLQAILLNYYNKHHSSLQPAFWHRFFMRKVDINFKNFGDTYNHLAQVELEKKHVSATIHYYKLLIAQGAFSDETAIFVAAKLIEFIDILPANNKNRDIVFDILQSLADRYYAQKKYQITQSFLAPIARYGADLKLKQKAMLGVCYLNMDNRESSAYPYLNDVLRVNPSDLFLKEKVADVLFSKQEWDKALAIYTPLFENKKELKIKMIECYCQLAEQLYDEKNAKNSLNQSNNLKALDFYNMALNLDASLVKPLWINHAANCQLMVKNTIHEIACVNCEIGDIYLQKNDYESAKKYYEMSYKQRPVPEYKEKLIKACTEGAIFFYEGREKTLLNKIKAYVSASDIVNYPLILIYLSRAMNLAPANPGEMHNLLINAYEKCGEYQQAVDLYEKMSTEHPNYSFVIQASTYYLLAAKLKSSKIKSDLAKVNDYLKKAYKLEPLSLIFQDAYYTELFEQGKALFNKKHYIEAIVYLEDGYRIRPDEKLAVALTSANYFIAYELFDQAKFPYGSIDEVSYYKKHEAELKEALKYLNSAKEFDKANKSAEVNYLLGEIHHFKGSNLFNADELKRATQFYEEAIRLNGDNPFYLWACAKAYSLLDNDEEYNKLTFRALRCSKDQPKLLNNWTDEQFVKDSERIYKVSRNKKDVTIISKIS